MSGLSVSFRELRTRASDTVITAERDDDFLNANTPHRLLWPTRRVIFW